MSELDSTDNARHTLALVLVRQLHGACCICPGRGLVRADADGPQSTRILETASSARCPTDASGGARATRANIRATTIRRRHGYERIRSSGSQQAGACGVHREQRVRRRRRTPGGRGVRRALLRLALPRRPQQAARTLRRRPRTLPGPGPSNAVHGFRRLLRRAAVEKKIQETMTDSRPYYTVIGVSYHPDASYEKVIQHMKKVFKPFIYVVVIHVPYLDKELPTCLILPPTLLENPAEATSSNQPSVMEAMRHVERMRGHELHLPVTISFTLRARIYRPASVRSTSFYEPFQKCRDYSGDSDVSPASVCKGQYGSNFNYFKDGESAFAFDTQQELTITYDTDITIRTKVCRAKLAYPNVPFGIAAFDINLDVADSACYSLQIEAGNFTRLKVLSSLNDYISGYHWNFDQCMNSI
ncbi:uncharacterized protein [Dermacentor albipictus]|uniref:uncharacterized protein isoform X3 n=1 Tax=Dermacentor albipictus TaxID=60249 RepID=UPI0031FDA9B6